MNYMDTLRGSTRTNAPTVNRYAGEGSMLVAVASDHLNWQRERRDLAAERAERETIRLMSNRYGVCG